MNASSARDLLFDFTMFHKVELRSPLHLRIISVFDLSGDPALNENDVV